MRRNGHRQHTSTKHGAGMDIIITNSTNTPTHRHRHKHQYPQMHLDATVSTLQTTTTNDRYHSARSPRIDVLFFFFNTECGNFDCFPRGTVDTTGGNIQDRARVRFSVNLSVSLCYSFARSLVQNHQSSRGPSALNTGRVEFNPICVREDVSVQFVLPCSFFCKRVVAHGSWKLFSLKLLA